MALNFILNIPNIHLLPLPPGLPASSVLANISERILGICTLELARYGLTGNWNPETKILRLEVILPAAGDGGLTARESVSVDLQMSIIQPSEYTAFIYITEVHRHIPGTGVLPTIAPDGLTVLDQFARLLHERLGAIHIVPVFIHVVWIGHISQYSPPDSLPPEFPKTIDALLQSEILKLDPRFYRFLPSDIGGFLSLLEAFIVHRIPSDILQRNPLEFFFHCYGIHVDFYRNLFQRFCHAIQMRYRDSIAPIFHVCAVENSLQLLETIDPVISRMMSQYLQFVQDPRVQNIRNLVNFKNLFHYLVLYRYGGTVFDANIFAVEGLDFIVTRLFDRISEFRAENRIFIRSASLAVLPVPLIPKLEPILMPIQSGDMPPLKIYRHKTKGSYTTRSEPGQIYDTFEASLSFDIYALRAETHLPILLNIMRFILKNFFRLSQIFLTSVARAGRAEDRKNLYTEYFACSVETSLIAAELQYLQNYLRQDQPYAQVHMQPQERNWATLLAAAPDKIQILLGNIGVQIFLNAPFIKVFSHTHNVKDAYWMEKECGENEAAAMSQHLIFDAQTIDNLSPYTLEIKPLTTQ